jgi:hypothetical protein
MLDAVCFEARTFERTVCRPPLKCATHVLAPKLKIQGSQATTRHRFPVHDQVAVDADYLMSNPTQHTPSLHILLDSSFPPVRTTTTRFLSLILSPTPSNKIDPPFRSHHITSHHLISLPRTIHPEPTPRESNGGPGNDIAGRKTLGAHHDVMLCAEIRV